jgi:hypothetical protein
VRRDASPPSWLGRQAGVGRPAESLEAMENTLIVNGDVLHAGPPWVETARLNQVQAGRDRLG